MEKRSSGVLLHITSLPGAEGVGTLGKDAFRFIDILAEAGQKFWQILPLGAVGYGDSPYQCYSAFAGNELLIDLVKLKEDGFLENTSLKSPPKFAKRKALFQKARTWKTPILLKAYQNFANSSLFRNEYQNFLDNNNWWLHDYALFISCKALFNGKVWNEWEDGLKYRNVEALDSYSVKLKEEIECQKFIQFVFFKQWTELKEHANSKGVKIIGDVPLYVSTDSADVWANTNLFLLDEKLKPTQVGGVPPDYFSEDGQLWGNPVFNWEEMKNQNYSWWLARLHFNLKMFDLVRIDHFRGLSSYWSVDATEKTAKKGKWVEAYGYDLLLRLKEQLGALPLIAEDLGEIDENVEKLRDDFALPGMKVLQFAFSSDETNEHLPHNYTPQFIAYTGTHDNNTSLGWYKSSRGSERTFIKKYFPQRQKRIVPTFIESVWSSSAQMAIIPLQDLFHLGESARMNVPGTATGNWGWRFSWRQLKSKHIYFLKMLTEKYNR